MMIAVHAVQPALITGGFADALYLFFGKGDNGVHGVPPVQFN